MNVNGGFFRVAVVAVALGRWWGDIRLHHRSGRSGARPGRWRAAPARRDGRDGRDRWRAERAGRDRPERSVRALTWSRAAARASPTSTRRTASPTSDVVRPAGRATRPSGCTSVRSPTVIGRTAFPRRSTWSQARTRSTRCGSPTRWRELRRRPGDLAQRVPERHRTSAGVSFWVRGTSPKGNGDPDPVDAGDAAVHAGQGRRPDRHLRRHRHDVRAPDLHRPADDHVDEDPGAVGKLHRGQRGRAPRSGRTAGTSVSYRSAIDLNWMPDAAGVYVPIPAPYELVVDTLAFY